MSDSGAAGVSTAGESQTIALQRLDSIVQLNTSTAGQYTIRFGKGMATSLKIIEISTLLEIIIFYVVSVNILFLFCI